MRQLFFFILAFMLTGLVLKAQVNLQNGLIAYYPFNGNANDESGNGNTGVVNGASLTMDRLGNGSSAYSFNGVSDYIDCGNNSILNFGANVNFSVSLWFQTTQISTNYPVLLDKSSSYSDRSGYCFTIARNTINMVPFSYGTITAIGDQREINDGVWHHAVFIRNGSFYSFALDGVKVPDIEYPSYDLSNSAPLTIGKHPVIIVDFFKGKIDDIRIYNRALNDQEIQALYENTTISTTNQTKILGNTVEVPIITSQLNSSDNVISYQCNIVYDQTKLQYSDKTLVGTIADGGSVIVNSNTPGKLQISYMNSNPLSGAGDILKLQFNTLATGTSPITISNFLYNATPVNSITNGTITINENLPPTAAISISDIDGKVKPGDTITITATFNEPMADIPVPQILMSGAVTLPAANMTKVTDVVYTYTYIVGTGNGEVNITMATGTDLTGNTITATPTEGGVFYIDNMKPEVIITYSDSDLKVRAGDQIVITATFSEPISDISIPMIALTGANTLPATALNRISSTQFTYQYIVKNGNGNIEVSITSAADEVGNMLVESTNNALQVIEYLYGDVDDNGIVQAYDAALALQYSVGLDPLSAQDPLPWENWRILAADVDNVEGITANDASLILQYSADLIATFPVENNVKSALVTNDDILVSAEEGFLVFRSLGNLYGLNITINNYNNCLGTPVIPNKNLISAVNISDSFYAVGVATAIPLNNGEVILKIPYSSIPESGFSINLIINSTKKQVNVDLTTGVGQLSENKLLLFPNPAHDELHIKGIVCYRITILDINGKTVYDEPVTGSRINIDNLKTGLYLLQAETDDGIISERFVKR